MEQKYTKAYPGSLICQNFGEANIPHGYLLWDISDGSVEEVEIYNEIAFVDVLVNCFTDYDDLNLEFESTSKQFRIRVIWETYPSDITIENEIKIKKYLINKYNPISITWKKKPIVDNKIEIDNTENYILNITKKEVQHTIFKQHLEKLGHNEDFIQKVLTIDDEVERRMNLSEQLTNINWSIFRFWGENFKSYQEIDIDWNDKNGIILIDGENQQGKSTLYSLILYVLFGKTIETEKVQKYGDSRYINNILNVDYCNGGIVLEINGEYFGLFRQTERKWNRDKTEVTACPTSLKIYKLNNPLDDLTEDNCLENLTEEDRNKTEKYITSVIGDFDSCLRSILTTADTLNSILSINKSIFIDSLLADLGLEIFEKKLIEFKEYKKDKTKKDEKIVLDIIIVENEIQTITDSNKNINLEIEEITNIKVKKIEDDILRGVKKKEELIKKIHKIDPILTSLKPKDVTDKIQLFKSDIDKNEKLTIKINNRLSSLISVYDSNEYEKILQEKDEYRNWEYERKKEINEVKRNIEETLSKTHRINGDIERIKKDGKKMREDLVKLENSKICPTCEREYDKEEHKALIKKNIEEKKKEISNAIEEIKNKERTNIAHGESIKIFEKEILNIESIITEKRLDSEKLAEKLSNIQQKKNEFEERQKLENEIVQIPLVIENIKLKIEKEEKLLQEYDNSLNFIKENSETDIIIQKVVLALQGLENEKNKLITQISNMNASISVNEEKILNQKTRLKKFKEQQERDNLYKVYESCIHRDGIPSFVLSKAIPMINKELESLLTDVDFNVKLDEDFSFKMEDKEFPGSPMNVIEGSGMERTFGAIALKFVLNLKNVKSKPTLMIIDEVTGKLDPKNFTKFVDLLNVMKQKMEKIIIIQHGYNLISDYKFTVVKEENKISNLIIN
jgi:hypothetical protein